MKSAFSIRGLIWIGIIVLCMIGLYMIFLIGPFFLPLWKMFQTIAVPFILSMIMAYLLNPLVDVLMRFRLGRTVSILLIYLFFLGLLSLIIWRGMPVFVIQMKGLVEELPQVEKNLQQWFWALDQQLTYLPEGLHRGIDHALGNVEYGITRVLTGVLTSLGELIGNFFVLIVVPFLVFYLLNDVQMIQKTVYFFVPRKQRKAAIKLWKDIDHSLAEYIRGQITVSLIVGLLAFLGYYMIGLPYALFLSVIVGITNIIPYFGPFIGAAPAILIAFLSQPSLVIWVIIINTVIQILEGNILGPWIVGKRLHIHPIFIIFALLIGAEFAGILGLILAVPIFVVFKVLILNTVLHVREYRKGEV